MFEVPKGAVEVSAFVRMILAVELGDTRPGEAFAMAAEAAVKAGQQYVLRQVRQAGS